LIFSGQENKQKFIADPGTKPMSTISLSRKEREDLLKTLKARFEHNMNRHKDLQWPNLQARLEATPAKLWSLNEMETSGGEPDVVSHDTKTGEYIFATTAQRWMREKKTSPKVTRWKWHLPWALSF
jgi:Protein of unknown function (DUF4256)